MEGLKEALRYLIEIGAEAARPEVLEICGKTYSNKNLVRYDQKQKAEPLTATSLTALVEYILTCQQEFTGKMLIYVVSPKEVRLISELDEERRRETLFCCKANTSEFRFDEWYDQERFVIELQANFDESPDLSVIQRVAGNVEAKTTATYGDDGTSQKTTIKTGISTLEDVLVPNPVTLVPYRTFLEVEQPASLFVFRIRDRSGEPNFKLIEAEGGLWKSEAVRNIKEYLLEALMEAGLPENIPVIG